MSDVKEPTELELLKARAETMGISFHSNIGARALKKKIADALEDVVEAPKPVLVAAPTAETIPARNARLRKEANRLVRVNITCMNPNKKNWPGEFISVSNTAIGVIKKFIPFNAEDGYHVPVVILNILQDRKYQTVVVVTQNGKKIKRSKLVKEFAIEILPALTIDELKDLAVRQAANRSLEE